MLSVKGLYDGENIKFLENVNIKGPKEVIITFLDNDLNELRTKDLYVLAENSKAFDFLKEPYEDIYSDKDLKVKYKK